MVALISTNATDFVTEMSEIGEYKSSIRFFSIRCRFISTVSLREALKLELAILTAQSTKYLAAKYRY